MPSSFCFGEEWLLFTHHLNPSLAELISSFSYHASSPTLPLKLETEYREHPSLKPHLTTIALRRYLSSLSTHCTEEIPQLTLQASHTRSLLSSFLLPSTSAGSLYDQLAMVFSSYGLIQSFPTEGREQDEEPREIAKLQPSSSQGTEPDGKASMSSLLWLYVCVYKLQWRKMRACSRLWTPRIESWAGQCNLSDVSLLAEDTARTGWLEWMGSLHLSWTTQILWHIPLSSELPNGLITPSKPRPKLALLLIAQISLVRPLLLCTVDGTDRLSVPRPNSAHIVQASLNDV
ncbi:hypothetical protein Bca101_030722 [Brassica carinata]